MNPSEKRPAQNAVAPTIGSTLGSGEQSSPSTHSTESISNTGSFRTPKSKSLDAIRASLRNILHGTSATNSNPTASQLPPQSFTASPPTMSSNTMTTDTSGIRCTTIAIRFHRIRKHWVGRVDCTISLVAGVIGIGNLTFFPVQIYKHGAGTFLFPLIVLMFALSVPMFYMEVLVGQLTGQGAAYCWSMVPLFRGVGLSILVTSLVMTTLYSFLCTYPLFYFGSSFIDPLPWAHCDHVWNTDNCLFVNLCTELGLQKMANGSCYDKNNALVGIWNTSAAEKVNNKTYVFSSREYWIEKMSRESSGTVHSHMVVCLLAVWFICFLALARDVITLGKIMIFTVLFMYTVLIVLVINGALLPNGLDGVIYFFTPTWKGLDHVDLWHDLSYEAFKAVMVGTGVISTFSSFSRYSDGDPLKMAVIVVSVELLTSVLGGVVFFTRVGYLASQLGKSIAEVSDWTGFMPAYVVYPESILRFSAGPFLSIIFFFALSGLGITTLLAYATVPTTMLLDRFPRLARHRILTLAAFCCLGFLAGLPFTFGGGVEWVTYMWTVLCKELVLLNGLLQFSIISWVYGIDHFLRDVKIMTGKTPSKYFPICWKYIIPTFTLAVLVSSKQGWKEVLAALVPLLCFLLPSLHLLWRLKKPTFHERVKASMKPACRWTRASTKSCQGVSSESSLKPKNQKEEEKKSCGSMPSIYIKKEVMSEARFLRNYSSTQIGSNPPSRFSSSKSSLSVTSARVTATVPALPNLKAHF